MTTHANRTTSIAPLDPTQAPAAVEVPLQAVHKMLGGIPNLFRVAAVSAPTLEALVGMFGATSKSSLRPKVREAIAMTVAQDNGCDYCLSAHTVLGTRAGLSYVNLVADTPIDFPVVRCAS